MNEKLSSKMTAFFFVKAATMYELAEICVFESWHHKYIGTISARI
jgi:hypothetical protein